MSSRHRGAPCRRAAFTLIELLVVVSIIAVLLGLLLPALGEAKRRARLLKDVANLSQNGKAIASYGAQNRGRMPNIPPGNGGQGTIDLGERGRPAIGFATVTQNGGGLDLNSPYAHNGWAIPPGLFYDDVWKMHHIAFGDYVVDSEGADLLHEVFVSPGGTDILDNWEDFKSGRLRGPNGDLLQWPQDFIMSGVGAGSGRATSAWVGPIDNPVQVFENNAPPSTQHHAWMLQGSYRYSLAGLYGSRTEFATSNNAAVNFWQGGTSISSFHVWNQFQSFQAWRSYRQFSDFNHPSKKVAFWDFWASNQSNVRFYFDPRAEIAAATTDGGARVVKPLDEAPTGIESAQAVNRNEGLGTRLTYGDNTGHPNTWEFADDGSAVPNPSPVHPVFGPYAWYAHTFMGPAGRDFK